MTTDNESLPPAWLAALERFKGGFGAEFDPTDRSDIWCLMPLLEEAVHDRMMREVVKAFREATIKAKEELEVLRREQRRRDEKLVESINGATARIREQGRAWEEESRAREQQREQQRPG